jgi:hypothetical protein
MARKTKADRIAEIDLEIEQLTNQRKQLEAQERERARKERTNRLCKRGGLLESMLPDTIKLTDEQFQTFFEKTLLTDFTRRTLAAIGAENAAPTAEAQGDTETQTADLPAEKPTGAAQNGVATSVTDADKPNAQAAKQA